jgi:hypothetical membrane protein
MPVGHEQRHGEAARLEARAGGLMAVAGAQLLLVINIGESLYRSYVVNELPISQLGVGPHAALFNASLALAGGMAVMAAFYLGRAGASLAVRAALGLLGLGCLGAGMVPMAPGLEGVHAVFALVAFVAASLAAFALWRAGRGPFRWLAVSLGLVSLAGLLLHASSTNLGMGEGMERMIVLPAVLLLATAGGWLLAPAQAPRLAPARNAAPSPGGPAVPSVTP